MAPCLTIQTFCHYLHCGTDIWQNSYSGDIHAFSIQTSSKTLFILSVRFSSEIIFLCNDPFSPNQWTSFYMVGTLRHEIIKKLRKLKMWAERIPYFLVPFHVLQTLRIHSEITLLHFFERSGIVPICCCG